MTTAGEAYEYKTLSVGRDTHPEAHVGWSESLLLMIIQSPVY